jgi:arylformamidase
MAPSITAGQSVPVQHVDISVALVPGQTPIYPGDTDLEVDRVQHLAHGDPANVSRLVCSTHCGTHVDAAVHFIEDRPGVEQIALDALLGRCWVADATAVEDQVDAAALRHLDIPDDATRVLFRTRNSQLWEHPKFTQDFVALAPDGADELVRRGIRLVGIDYLSIAPYDDPGPTHEALLRAGVTILETLDLRHVDPGWWTLTCLPLLLVGADGAPARAVLSRSE